MNQLSGLHHDARKRFDELGRDLLGRVIAFREPPREAKRGFLPDVFKSSEITDKDIIGDVHLGWQNEQGEPTGIAVAEIGGERTGLLGEGYAKLESLARAMAKVRPFADTASVKFLRTQIFEWVKQQRRGASSTGCVDFVLSALADVVTERRIMIPVSDLQVESPLTFGSVTVSTFPQTIFEQLESKKTTESEAEAHKEWCQSLRKKFQGFAVAEATAFGEPIRAQEIVVDQIELVIGVLRFFAPAHLIANVVSRVARWGYAPERSETVLLTDVSGRCSSIETALIDGPGRMVISNETRGFLLGAGLSEVREIIACEERTDLEQAILTAMVTFGRAALTPDFRERIVWYCAGLESILLKDSSEPILHNLGERLAIFAYDTVDERSEALVDVKKAYSLRSGFVHHGIGIEDGEVVARFAKHGLKLLLRTAKNSGQFRRKDQLLEHIDRMKLFGMLPLDPPRT